MKRMLCLLMVLFCVFLSACTSDDSPEATAGASFPTDDTTTPTKSVTKELVEQVEIGMSIKEVRGLLGTADADVGSGETIEMYVLNDGGEVAIFSYHIDSEGVSRVSHIYIGALPSDSPYWSYLQ